MYRQLAANSNGEGFLRAMASGRIDVVSAGSEETPLDPDAVEAMHEVGIDISGQQTKALNRFLGRRFSYVVTLCDRLSYFSGQDLATPTGS